LVERDDTFFGRRAVLCKQMMVVPPSLQVMKCVVAADFDQRKHAPIVRRLQDR
jgi:hypothetical protein